MRDTEERQGTDEETAVGEEVDTKSNPVSALSSHLRAAHCEAQAARSAAHLPAVSAKKKTCGQGR